MLITWNLSLQINTECNLCLSPSNEYPKSSIFFLNIQETQLQQTNVTVVIEDVSESFTSFQISSIVSFFKGI